MKNRLLPLLFVLGSYSAYSQVGIGTLSPSTASQLEIVASDRGILIPRVALTSSADTTTITNKNVESLLVFNTASVSDIKPGYYYWYDGKWNRMAISSEVTGGSGGVIGGNGIPGNKGEVGYPGKDVSIYTDQLSGIVYVQNADGTWTTLNGTNGLDGKNGISGGAGLPGDAGLDGTIQMYIDQSTGIVYVRDPKDATKWVPITGQNGIDGIKGIDGEPGKEGTITTLDAIVKDGKGNIYAYVGDNNTVAGRDKEWADKSPNWVKINGLNGEDGIQGVTGEPGTAGSITTLDAIVKSPNGDIYAYVGVDKTVDGRDKEWAEKSPNWVKINGLNGKEGIAGTTGEPGTPGSITTLDAIVKSPNGDIYAYTGTDQTVAGRDKEWADKSPNWVKINGLNGEDGIQGVTGEPGTAGSITTLDAIVKSPNGDIYAYVGVDKTVDGRDKEWADKSPNWVKINGLNGKEGIAGTTGEPGTPGSITTLDAIVKSPNGDIYAYTGTDQTVAGRDAEWASKSPNWVKINGLNGKEGIAGAIGEPGTPGSITTLDAIVKSPNGDIYAYTGTSQTVAERDAEWTAKSPNWVKINGLNGKDGKDGVIGGKGIPGSKGETGYPGDNVAIYIDNETGTVYVRDPNNNDKWVPLSGKDGIDGIKGIDGEPGTAGTITTLDAIVKDGKGNIYAYVGDNNTVAGRDKEWADKSPNWVKINGLNGEDGIQGVTGEPGTAGSITTLDAIVKSPNGDIYAYTGTDRTVAGRDKEWADKSPNWVKINGLNGKEGIAGAIGEPGTPGSITTLDAIVKSPNGDIYAYTGTDQTVAGRDAEWTAKSPNWVKINGLNGKEGIPGATGEPGKAGSITTLDAIVKSPNGDIYAYIGTSQTVAERDAEWAAKSPNWAKINGLNGESGIPGADGEPGTPGSITTLDAIVKSPNGDIYAYVGTDKTVAGRDKEWVDKSPNWVRISGKDGVDGAPGLAGGPGAPGDTGVIIPEGTTTWINTTDGVIYVKDAAGEWIAVSGKVAPNNILGIQVISDDYVVTVDDYTVIAEDLTKDITITLPDPALSKGRILVINQFDIVKADDTPIVVNFNYEIRYSSKARYTYMTGSLFGGATSGSMKVTLQSNGVNWYVITYTM